MSKYRISYFSQDLDFLGQEYVNGIDLKHISTQTLEN
jgi:hypothetical protein